MEGRNINIPGHLFSLATFTFNFGYFALLPSPILIFIHLWSISFEEQFYAFIPWVLQRLSLVKVKMIWISIGTAYLIGSTIRFIFIYYQFRHPTIYFLPITHFDSIICGIILGLGLVDKFLNKLHSGILFFSGGLVIAALFFLPNNNVIGWNLMLTYPLIGLGMSFIIFSNIQQEKTFFRKFMSNPIIIYLGKISYGLYVFHPSSFILAVTILSRIAGLQQLTYPNHTWFVLSLGFVITILFSTTSYHLLEKPFIRWKNRFSFIASGYS
jgi:peptidoglycan/LPS O-acetylase OafA/YrhL